MAADLGPSPKLRTRGTKHCRDLIKRPHNPWRHQVQSQVSATEFGKGGEQQCESKLEVRDGKAQMWHQPWLRAELQDFPGADQAKPSLVLLTNFPSPYGHHSPLLSWCPGVHPITSIPYVKMIYEMIS